MGLDLVARSRRGKKGGRFALGLSRERFHDEKGHAANHEREGD